MNHRFAPSRSRLRPSTAVCAMFAVACTGAGLATAQTADSEPAQEGSAPSYWQEHFSLHGYATIGYAQVNSAVPGLRTADEVILGLEADDSFPYGNAALNLRYDPAAKHAFILQLAASDLGDSPVDDIESDIEVDWLFYQFQIASNTRLRIGRQPAPAGIFNELRDVGVLLPFFRPAFTFYREGALFSETVDGVGLSHRFFAGKPWKLEADVYYGEFTVLEQGGGFSDVINEADVTGALGTQLWLETPLSGLRLGLGGLRWDVAANSAFNAEETTWKSWYASVDGVFERFTARGEYRRLEVDVLSPQSPVAVGLGIDLYYFQLGWNATEKLAFYAQPEFTDIEQAAVIFTGGSTQSKDRRDFGVSVVYQFRPTIVLKGEYHEVENELPVGNELVFGPQGPSVRILYDTFESDYSILSLALSF